jgi:5-methylcytosine-specific restriction protein A
MAVRRTRGRSNWSRDTRRVQFTPAQVRFIINRDRGLCYLCGLFGDEADHVIPIAEGGANDVANGGCICTSCHDTKTREESLRGQARRQERLHLKSEPRPFDHFKPKD